jgi:hypothetical protein
MAFSADLGELYIADACNHRIVVTDPEGRPQRALGGPGRGAGLLAYPYDVMVLEDGTLLVSEFGNKGDNAWGSTGAWGPARASFDTRGGWTEPTRRSSCSTPETTVCR